MIDQSFNKHRYFRIRKASNTAEINAVNEMFHIPTSMRHKIQEYRYSLLGYPCLYLASSLYTCWEELARPAFNSIVLSRFEPTASYDNAKILFLATAPIQFKEEIERRKRIAEHFKNPYDIENLSCFFEFWPLQLACSIPTKRPDGVFHEEYIIPQFLMEWIRDSESAHGICYRTTKVPQVSADRLHPALLYNYAFPARTLDSNYCSKLSRDFLLTPPVSFELSIACKRREQLRNGGFYNSSPRMDGFNPAMTPFMLPEGISSQYEVTSFFDAELSSACDQAIYLQCENDLNTSISKTKGRQKKTTKKVTKKAVKKKTT